MTPLSMEGPLQKSTSLNDFTVIGILHVFLFFFFLLTEMQLIILETESVHHQNTFKVVGKC